MTASRLHSRRATYGISITNYNNRLPLLRVRCKSRKLESAVLDILLQRLAKIARETILLKVGTEPGVLTLKISVTVGNQSPRDDATHCREGGSNEEDCADALEIVAERVLNGSEYLNDVRYYSNQGNRCC